MKEVYKAAFTLFGFVVVDAIVLSVFHYLLDIMIPLPILFGLDGFVCFGFITTTNQYSDANYRYLFLSGIFAVLFIISGFIWILTSW
jgi:hypothetical protein